MSIDTELIESRALQVINPATEEVIEEIRTASERDVREAIALAKQRLATWRWNTNRRDLLRECAAVLGDKRNVFALAKLLTTEQGKPKREAVAEIMASAHWMKSIANLDMPTHANIETRVGTATTRYEAKGVVAAITPWNFPVFLAVSKMAQALYSGNVVVIKPSPHTPLTTVRMISLLTESGGGPLPDGVVSPLVGEADIGKRLISDVDVNHVSFTGSTNVGRQIAVSAAANLTSTTLELGGNDAGIVCSDANVQEAVPKIFEAAFTNAGQFCTGIKRLFVHESVFDEVVNALATKADASRVGDGAHPQTRIGPLSCRQQFEKVLRLMDDTRARDATIKSGGTTLDGPGYFYRPTIVTNIEDDAALVTEEQFGPVLPVLRFSDIEDAIARANRTSFGLGGSLWGEDDAMLREQAAKLNCGTVWLNQHGALDPAVPFSGRRDSGNGIENGWRGIMSMTNAKSYFGISHSDDAH